MLGVLVSISVSSLVAKTWGEALVFFSFLFFLLLLSQSEMGLLKLSLNLELDSVSWALVLLSIWVVLMAMLGSGKIKSLGRGKDSFMLMACALLLSLVSSFSVSNMTLFYVMFECCLIPVFIMVVGWGGQPERTGAGTYLVAYTLLGSLPLFLVILRSSYTSGLSYLYSLDKSNTTSVFFVFFFIMAFLVKFPMYGVHLWLLKAHVEAPVAGSMVLAGVLLKLGGYGLIRILGLMKADFNCFNEVIVSLSLWGGVLVSVSCLRQVDMKLLIAMSSVVHMSMCVSGVFTSSVWGLKGVILMMVAHGVCSSGLFYLANIVYERTNSRSLFVSKGMLNLMPSMCFCWFFICAANMSAPPSINLMGEILLMSGLVCWDISVFVSIGFISFFSAAFSLFLFSMSQHGAYLSSKTSLSSGLILEFLICFLHLIPLNILIICGSLMI